MDFDYLNARIKGMSCRLLGRDFYEQALGAPGVQTLLDGLLGSDYGPLVSEALSGGKSIERVESACMRAAATVFESVRGLAAPDARSLLDVQFHLWDMHNIVSILRGKVTRAAQPEAIVRTLLPAGVLTQAQLEELSHEKTTAEVVDTLTFFAVPFASDIRSAVRAGGSVPDMEVLETVLWRAAFGWAQERIAAYAAHESPLYRHVEYQIDLFNMRKALWAVRAGESRRELRDGDFLSGGALSRELFSRIAACTSLEHGMEILANTHFSVAVDNAILPLGQQGKLGGVERFFEIEIYRYGCRLFRTDPLGAGVPFGYLWRKYNEAVNVRVLLRGKTYGVPPATIREEMYIE
jgi:V/A-type H+-transporting ATPase subunit C